MMEMGVLIFTDVTVVNVFLNVERWIFSAGSIRERNRARFRCAEVTVDLRLP